MNINKLTQEYINKKRYRSLAASRRKLYPKPGAAWIQGWDAAIRFAKQVEKAQFVCEQCGKLIPHYGDFNMDNQGVVFCAKCHDKLFKKSS